MSHRKGTALVGIRCPAPVFAVRGLEAALAFYARLGFEVRSYDSRYGYAEREGLRIHLRASPELEPFSNYAEAYVETSEVDRLHEEWQGCGLLPVPGVIGPELKAEVRRRWEAGEPVGPMSELVEDKPLAGSRIRYPRSRQQSPSLRAPGRLTILACRYRH